LGLSAASIAAKVMDQSTWVSRPPEAVGFFHSSDRRGTLVDVARRTKHADDDRLAGAPDARTAARIEDLETRVRQLEARLRSTMAQGRVTRAAKPPRVARRPRCPGCTLELPPGRRGANCVWCGFRFDAVSGLLR
jgi:hypothetical protein